MPTVYGEVPADDIYAVADQIVEFIESHGQRPDGEMYQIASGIIGYIDRRSRGWRADEIHWPTRTNMYKPKGWEERQEEIWCEWVYHHFTLDNWQREVMHPIFGDGQRIWETACDGWRDEIYAFLPLWIERSHEMFDRIDPTQLPSTIEIQEAEREEAAQRKRQGLRIKDVDPYTVEYEERHGRGRY